jgi:hypothetical protein
MLFINEMYVERPDQVPIFPVLLMAIANQNRAAIIIRIQIISLHPDIFDSPDV